MKKLQLSLLLLAGTFTLACGKDLQVSELDDITQDYTETNRSDNNQGPSGEGLISDSIKLIPDAYRKEAGEKGKVVRLDYGDKYALVYLPHGYDESDRKYDVFYLMHGGGGSPQTWFAGGAGSDSSFKRLLDNMMEQQETEPFIVVCPTFYAPVSNEYVNAVSVFPEEFKKRLIPAVDEQFRTLSSRNHRFFGGFSMGSVCTWYVFLQALDSVRYFAPHSGDCWVAGQMGGENAPERTAELLADAISTFEYTPKDFFIYSITGSNDIAYSSLRPQIEAMKGQEKFIFSNDMNKGNLYFSVLEGASHTYSAAEIYAYNAMLAFCHKR